MVMRVRLCPRMESHLYARATERLESFDFDAFSLLGKFTTIPQGIFCKHLCSKTFGETKVVPLDIIRTKTQSAAKNVPCIYEKCL